MSGRWLVAAAVCASAWIWVGCPQPTVDAGPGDPEVDAGADLVDAGPDQSGPPRFASPAEAEDLDEEPGVLRVALTASVHTWEAGGVLVEGYAYNGQVPGPTLRLSVGDQLIVDVQNDLDTPTTIHWHGLEVPWAMDGALWMQEPIAPGASFRYEFTVGRAGTFWYHPHFDTARQVDLGLYGALIVEDPSEPELDDELVMVIDDVAEVDADGEFVPRVTPRWTVNGLVAPVLSIDGPRAIRARVINVANGAYLDLAAPGLRQIAGDQGLLGEAIEPPSVLLTPGDRVELELLLGDDDVLLTALPASPAGASPVPAVPILQVEQSGTGAAPAPRIAGPGAEPPTPMSSSALLYVFAGDDSSGEWRINGEAFPDVTVSEVVSGEPTQVTVRNVSSRDHPFHVHGMVFEVLAVDGEVPDQQRLEDTLNVPHHTDATVLLFPEEPGEWMLHCHILAHAEGGMMTVLRVVED